MKPSITTNLSLIFHCTQEVLLHLGQLLLFGLEPVTIKEICHPLILDFKITVKVRRRIGEVLSGIPEVFDKLWLPENLRLISVIVTW
jgi:hypothetical protein